MFSAFSIMSVKGFCLLWYHIDKWFHQINPQVKPNQSYTLVRQYDSLNWQSLGRFLNIKLHTSLLNRFQNSILILKILQ